MIDPDVIFHQLAGRLPGPIQRPLRSVQAEIELQRFLRRHAGERHRAQRSGPTPPADVVSATSLMSVDELEEKSTDTYFRTSGKRSLCYTLRLAGEAGLDLRTATAAFELGCGGARLLRHLRRVDGLRLVGSDLIEDNVNWCRANIAGIEFHPNEFEPPLAFADDGSFDLVIAFSVFTHIPMPLQLPWVEEISRILKPGGVAVVTVIGETAAQKMMNPADLEAFHEEGEFTMDSGHSDVSASSAIIGSWDVFMSEQRVRELYGAVLEVRHYGGGFQIPVALRKPE